MTLLRPCLERPVVSKAEPFRISILVLSRVEGFEFRIFQCPSFVHPPIHGYRVSTHHSPINHLTRIFQSHRGHREHRELNGFY
jgi:hypothetical protein